MSKERDAEITRLNFDMAQTIQDQRQAWTEFFNNALFSLIDYEMRHEALTRAVESAAYVADRALQAVDERWGKR